jgi:dsRNA-specific ribonuclease
MSETPSPVDTCPDLFRLPPASRAQIEAVLHPWVPRDLTLYWSALTHPSVHYVMNEYPSESVHPWYRNGHPVYGINYEKLEFLGDSVIHLCLANILIRMYPDKNEGFLSRVRINIERKQGLAMLSREVGLDRLIKTAPGMAMTDAVLENVFEGFVGALFEDQQKYIFNGLQCCHAFVHRTLHRRFDNIHDIRVDDNYKDTVLRLMDRKVFESVDFTYTYENKRHNVCVICKYTPTKIADVRRNSYMRSDLALHMAAFPSVGVNTAEVNAHGRSKPEAEQAACKNLMDKLGIRMERL